MHRLCPRPATHLLDAWDSHVLQRVDAAIGDLERFVHGQEGRLQAGHLDEGSQVVAVFVAASLDFAATAAET